MAISVHMKLGSTTSVSLLALPSTLDLPPSPPSTFDVFDLRHLRPSTFDTFDTFDSP
jgi:hypothetical protein